MLLYVEQGGIKNIGVIELSGTLDCDKWYLSTPNFSYHYTIRVITAE